MFWDFIEGRIFGMSSGYGFGRQLTDEEEREHWRQAFLFRDWLQGTLTTEQYEQQSGKKAPWNREKE